MHVMIVGDWHSDLHEEEVFHSLTRLGHDVIRFPWHHYFSVTGTAFVRIQSLLQKVSNKFLIGPSMAKINRDLVGAVKQKSPDVVLFYRGTHIYPATLKQIKLLSPKSVLVGYNNDNPFSSKQSWYLWRFFISSLSLYDLVLAYRKSNVDDYYKAGAVRVELLRSWFVPSRNYALEPSEMDFSRFRTDVVFIGHYEDDQRLEYLESIVEAGYTLRIFGPPKEWVRPITRSKVLRHLHPISVVWGDEYNKALNCSKVALCFFSKLNIDTYTRRCFEIPATCTLLLSEYSDDLSDMFSEGVEADYFRNKNELLQKIALYIHDTKRCREVAHSGYRRVIEDGHDIDSRMKQLFETIEGMRKYGHERQAESSGSFVKCGAKA